MPNMAKKYGGPEESKSLNIGYVNSEVAAGPCVPGWTRWFAQGASGKPTLGLPVRGYSATPCFGMHMTLAPFSQNKRTKATRQNTFTISNVLLCELGREMQSCTKTKKRKKLRPLICERSAGALLERCQRPLAVICVWLSVSLRVCVCVCVCAPVSSVFLSEAAAGTHASPPHHDTHQALFSCSPDLPLTFPPSSPTLTHTH